MLIVLWKLLELVLVVREAGVHAEIPEEDTHTHRQVTNGTSSLTVGRRGASVSLLHGTLGKLRR